MLKYPLFILLALISEILGTVSGFGSSILFVPLASFFFDFKNVLGITAVFHIFSNVAKLILFRKGIRKDIALKLGVPAIFFVIMGALFTTVVPSHQIELAMNLILVLLAIYLVININRPLKQTDNNLYIGGVTSGFIAGITGSGGAIRGITLAAFKLPKEVFIATSAFIDLGVDSSRAIIYISNGYLDKKNVSLIPVLLFVSFIGGYVGKLVINKTTERFFQYLILIVIMLTSLVKIIMYLI